MTTETLTERDRTREKLDTLQREWLAADDTSMGYRDAREDYLLALADAYESGQIITRAEADRLAAEAVEKEREGCAALLNEIARGLRDDATKADGLGFYASADIDRECARVLDGMAAAIRARADRQTEGE